MEASERAKTRIKVGLKIIKNKARVYGSNRKGKDSN